MDVSENNGILKSSILIGFSIINHPFWGIPPIFGNTETPAYSTKTDETQDSLGAVQGSPRGHVLEKLVEQKPPGGAGFFSTFGEIC